MSGRAIEIIFAILSATCAFTASVKLLCGAEPLQIMPADKLAMVRASLPAVASSEMRAILSDQATLWYTNAEVPPAYQFAETGSITGNRRGTDPDGWFLDVRYNISGDAREAAKGHGFGGNGNVEFPWRTAGGLDKSERETTAYRFLHLPPGLPVVTWVKPVFMPNTRNGQGQIVGGLTQYMTAWTYPEGTMLGEVLFQRSPAGDLVAFEIRTRTKEGDSWQVDILRPFPTANDLSKELAGKGMSTLASAVLASAPAPAAMVDRSHPTKSGFSTAAATDQLPLMPAHMVDELLTQTPFKSALGIAWKSAGDEHAFAPTATEYSIVPPGYAATFLGTDSASCMNCHKHTLKHVNEFDLGRDWYGTIRGSDGIFTFHPMEPNCVAMNNRRVRPTLRQAFIDAGIVAKFDPSIHSAKVYTQTKEVP